MSNVIYEMWYKSLAIDWPFLSKRTHNKLDRREISAKATSTKATMNRMKQ